MLLDNYLPDGKGITLISNPMLARANCSVIFITGVHIASGGDENHRAVGAGQHRVADKGDAFAVRQVDAAG
jgi:hypothetical protein